MASRWLPIILALEIESAGWQANSSVGDTQAYPRDEHCQSSVGSAADPWRTPQARRRYRTDQRGHVHGQATRPAVPGLEDIPPFQNITIAGNQIAICTTGIVVNSSLIHTVAISGNVIGVSTTA